MSESDPRTTHSGFAQFPDLAARERFVRQTLDRDADLRRHAYLPETRATIVFENLTAPELTKVRDALQGTGRWVDDVQFRTMG